MDLPLPPEIVQDTLLELVRMPRTDMRAAVEKYLRTAAEGLDVERAGLWYFSPDRAAIVETYRYEKSRRRFFEPGTVAEAAAHPAYFKALNTGGIVAAEDALTDPRTAEFAADYLKPQRIYSMLDVPIWRSGEMAGILCLESVGEKRPWLQEEQLFAGGIGAMITLAIEVDARRQAEQEAVAREAELRTILDHVPDIVMIVDQAANVRFLNRKGREFLQRPDEAAAPSRDQMRRALNAQNAEGRPLEPHELPLSRALAGATVLDAVVYGVDPRTGRRIVTRTNASPFHDAAGNVAGAVSITRDVTALAELDDMKDQFLRVSAHELRTPVSIIKGYAQLMKRRLDEGKPIEAPLVQAVLQGSDRLSRLVVDMLEALRYQSDMRALPFEFGKVDIASLTREAACDLGVTAKRPRINVHDAPGVTVTGDMHRLRQVLLILFDNAVKYSPGRQEIEANVKREGGEAVIEVSDSGVGVPPEKRDRIFDIFYRAHTDTPNDFGGLGVGLYLARQIIERHGGKIGYTPRQPGSTFWVRIPAAC